MQLRHPFIHPVGMTHVHCDIPRALSRFSLIEIQLDPVQNRCFIKSDFKISVAGAVKRGDAGLIHRPGGGGRSVRQPVHVIIPQLFGRRYRAPPCQILGRSPGQQ